MSNKTPICVDLDGSLIHSDLLLESFLFADQAQSAVFAVGPFWLLRGKAVLKAEIAARVELNGAALPYTQAFVAWLREQSSKAGPCGCARHLTTVWQAVADHLQIFDGCWPAMGRPICLAATRPRPWWLALARRGLTTVAKSTVTSKSGGMLVRPWW